MTLLGIVGIDITIAVQQEAILIKPPCITVGKGIQSAPRHDIIHTNAYLEEESLLVNLIRKGKVAISTYLGVYQLRLSHILCHTASY